MTRGKKTIEFDFDFTYAHGGKEDQHNVINLCAPGRADFKVHSTMTAYVNQALLQVLPRIKELIGEEGEREKKKELNDEQALEMIASGLGVKEYPKFISYLEKTLSGNARLATIGDTNAPITDLVWKSLEEEGGMDAIMKVMGAYVDFFTDKGTK